MCTIVGGKLNYYGDTINNSVEFGGFLEKFIINLMKMARTKGGDYINILFFNKDIKNQVMELSEVIYTKDENSFEKFVEYLLKKFKEYKYNESIELSFMLFSRLTPEMEQEGKILQQPYKTIDENFIMAHGTIPLKDFDAIQVDTELLRFQTNIKDSINLVESLNGKIATIRYSEKYDVFKAVNNGLGLYEYDCGYGLKYFSNINILENKVRDIKPYEFRILDDTNNFIFGEQIEEETRAIALFSGGLDILTSTHYHILKNNINKLDLLYFDWGTNASQQEIEAGRNYRNYLLNENILKDVTFKVLNVKDMFKNILNVCDLTKTRLTDPDAKGLGSEEAEEAISYVPVRNSMLINLAVAWAEQKYPNEKVNFIIGANLSEGMVYSDNTTAFIDYKNQEIKYIGQKTSKFNLVAPFANVTKTKMLETALKHRLETGIEYPFHLAFSCYFPVEGKPCRKCGSCLLKENAFLRAFGNAIPKFDIKTEK